MICRDILVLREPRTPQALRPATPPDVRPVTFHSIPVRERFRGVTMFGWMIRAQLRRVPFGKSKLLAILLQTDLQPSRAAAPRAVQRESAVTSAELPWPISKSIKRFLTTLFS